MCVHGCVPLLFVHLLLPLLLILLLVLLFLLLLPLLLLLLLLLEGACLLAGRPVAAVGFVRALLDLLRLSELTSADGKRCEAVEGGGVGRERGKGAWKGKAAKGAWRGVWRVGV